MAIAATANHNKSSAGPPTFSLSVSVGNWVMVNLDNGDPSHEPKISDPTNGDGKDSLGNVYVKVASPLHWSGSYFYQTLWYSTIITGGTATITGNVNGGGWDTPWMTAQEFNGVTGAATFDKSHTAEGSSTSAASGATITTAQANELLIGAIEDDFNGSPYTAGSGWTFWDKSADSNGGRAGAMYQVVSAAGTYNATATLNTSRAWGASIATFYDAGGGGGAAFMFRPGLNINQSVNRAGSI